MPPSSHASSVDASTESSSGYEDVPAADDFEDSPAVDLFSPQTFPSVSAMFAAAQKSHNLDFPAVCRKHGLDFYGKIKVVNWIRSEVKSGRKPAEIVKVLESDEKPWEDDAFLAPVLEDDAVLFGLDELEDTQEAKTEQDPQNTVKELEEKLSDLARQFSEYKDSVRQNFEAKLESTEDPSFSIDHDKHYFESYASNDIHETMLKDSVRTDAYRDFIYQNKDLFRGKTVLDVGCGTGILSMFCAKAGAKKVFAVDNSEISMKARMNFFENGLDGVITCLHGKVEELVLPVDKVDIIVSEWMGYCLLYEAMLDSVLFARDKWLKPDGLMVPSECRILIAPMQDPEYLNEKINFWSDIYGFRMSAMRDQIHSDIKLDVRPPSVLASSPSSFVSLPLHTITTADLNFTAPFSLTVKDDIESVDGWMLYFDTFFTPSREYVVPEGARAETWTDEVGVVGFTTGPCGAGTHWQQGLALLEEGKSVRKGEVKGEVTYRKAKENTREVEIEIAWEQQGRREKQMWHMR